MSKQTKRAQEELQMDMTPMIDCVFLLMIFFVLVIDLSQQELEDLILPKAEYAVPDEKPPENRPIINVTQAGRMIYKKNTYYDPDKDGDNFAGIKPLLYEWREHVANPESIKQEKVGGGMTIRCCTTNSTIVRMGSTLNVVHPKNGTVKGSMNSASGAARSEAPLRLSPFSTTDPSG